jgi:hypothetical protein
LRNGRLCEVDDDIARGPRTLVRGKQSRRRLESSRSGCAASKTKSDQ